MANIYLRVPTYIAQFFRNMDTDHRLTEFDPVQFSPYSAPSWIMGTALTLVDACAVKHTVCFSQRMWNNMLRGKAPAGDKTIVNRDPQEWLTTEEINTLNGLPRSKRMDSYDYLCIEAPKSVIVGHQYRQVTPSFTLPVPAANDLIRQLRILFVFRLSVWIRNEQMRCITIGIPIRDIGMCIDHFFFHYEMNMGASGTDRDSMRRMAVRWLSEANLLADEIDDEDVLHVYEVERANRIPSFADSLKDVKTSVKKM
jgi:hypothetical protein